MDEYILPAVSCLDIPNESVKQLLFTHSHGDHAGGLMRLAEAFPKARVFTSFEINLPDKETLADGKIVLGNLMAVYLPGHADHSFGFYDTETKTLLSGDCLQLDGVGKYRNGIWNSELYIASVQKLKNMEIKRIVASHEYDPLGSVAEGADKVEKYLNQCIAIVQSKK